MADAEQRSLLLSGVAHWNVWREAHADVSPDLTGANLRGTNLAGANLAGANLAGALLFKTNLSYADSIGGAGTTKVAVTNRSTANRVNKRIMINILLSKQWVSFCRSVNLCAKTRLPHR